MARCWAIHPSINHSTHLSINLSIHLACLPARACKNIFRHTWFCVSNVPQTSAGRLYLRLVGGISLTGDRVFSAVDIRSRIAMLPRRPRICKPPTEASMAVGLGQAERLHLRICHPKTQTPKTPEQERAAHNSESCSQF